MTMQSGTPELRLWAAVGLRLINDCRDEMLRLSREDDIMACAKKWKARAKEPTFVDILEILDLDPRKLVVYIDRFAEKTKTALRFRHSHEDYASLEAFPLRFFSGYRQGY